MNQNLLETVKLQQVASDPKNSAWVFASAGSGKTKILVDRVLRLLLSDVTPDKILCLTFTKNAALEMQDRINSELAKWILCDEEELVEKLKNLSGKSPGQDVLKKARTLFNAVLDAEFKIKTQTIHAFCQTIIKIFPFEADVRPSFEVIESAKESLLLKQVQKKLLQDAFIDKNLENLLKKINSKFDEESFLDVLSGFLSKKEKINFLKDEFFGIENVIAEIYKKFSVSPNYKKEDIFGEFLTKINFVEILQLAQELENTELKSNIDLTIAIRSFVNNQNLKSFDDFYSAFFTDKNEPRKLSKNTASNQLIKDLVEKQQILIADFLEELNSFTICDNSVAILTFVDLVLEKYNAIKKQNALLDYNDLIVKTNQLLANPEFSDWIKLKMDSSFDHILIDESQDTNHHQWNIIKALSEDFFSGLSAQNQNRSIFIVGDEKQSIYSFQGAEPNISEEIFTYFQNKLGDNLKKIELNNSFRSVNTVLNAVDRVFSQSDIKKSLSKLSEFKNHLFAKPINNPS
jgi:ATP-dependent helicase/nuclease subunit A